MLAACLSFSTPFIANASAQTPPHSEVENQSYDFDIEAQTLSSALIEFARVTDTNLLFARDTVAGLEAPALNGRFTRDEALRRLLGQSGLRAIATESGVRLVAERAPTEEGAAESEIGGEEIVVTGTRIRGAPPAGSNVLELDRETIEESGRTTLQDVLQTLPQVFTGSQSELSQLNSPAPGRNLSLGSSVDLRGLGSDATLTLFDGRRLAPAGLGNFVDISAIPLAAIERVEILADGASATYGADAVGGVVNIIPRRNLDGAETMLRYGGADGYDELGLSHAFGATWNGGSLIAGYEYRSRDALTSADRSFAADSDLSRYGGTNFSRTNANPGNIIRVGATNVVFAIPTGQDGTNLTMADLIAGQRNFQNTQEDNFLLPEQESHSAFATLRQDLTPDIEFFLDVLTSERDAHSERPQLNTTITVPETNYYRQNAGLFPGQGNLVIGYYFGNDFGPLMIDTSSSTWAAASGLDVGLFSDWRLEFAVSYGAHADENDNTNSVDLAALAPALASSNPATAFNPFGDGSHTPASVLAGMTSSQFVDTDSELVSYAIKLDGGLFDLPAGRVRAAFGAERRRETFSARQIRITALGVATTPRVQDPGRRVTDAYFGEVLAPIIGEDAGIPLIDALTLSLSVRYEESSDFGSATTPRIGLNWRLVDDLTLRGTWGTSFKAPQFTQMLTGTAGLIGAAPPSVDPNATNGNEGYAHLVYPRDYREGQLYPMVIVQYRSRGFLRGGTGGEYPIHVYAGRGYFVLSVERTDNLTLAAQLPAAEWQVTMELDGSERRMKLTQIEALIEQVRGRGIVDPDRIAITGFSDGAETAYHVLTRTDLIAAAVVSQPPSDPSVYALNSEDFLQTLRAVGTTAPWEENAEPWSSWWRDVGVIYHAERLRAPLLMNLADSEVLPGRPLAVRLRELGRAVETYVYPGAYHVKWRPRHQLAAQQRALDWIDFWLRGVEREDPLEPGRLERWRALRSRQAAAD